jgi:hypothetical protein
MASLLLEYDPLASQPLALEHTGSTTDTQWQHNNNMQMGRRTYHGTSFVGTQWATSKMTTINTWSDQLVIPVGHRQQPSALAKRGISQWC